ncbi:hypothetical protein DH2020_045888 [Rehmannia glutinosa]|uniref:Endonuclease/exonuclease/phosphatase domain-containing protein n=1 Tax=Rehmannia glutinosa TaxID=99300 RepID=A0ABR0UDN8_REHGL
MGGPSTVSQVKESWRLLRPDLFFLCETKRKKGFVKTVARQLRVDQNWFCVEPQGKSGGLFLCWSNEVKVLNIVPSYFSLEVEVLQPSDGSSIWVIFVYCSSQIRERVEQWDFFLKARPNWGNLWIIGGDFNDICGHEEKKGGRRRSHSSFDFFNSFIGNMGMKEISSLGNETTWANNRVGEGFVKEKLDRFFGSLDWLSNFPNAISQVNFRSSSDHCMICLDSSPFKKPLKKRFFFDKRWLHRERIDEVVQKSWCVDFSGVPMYRVQSKISECRIRLLKWSSNFRNLSNARMKLLNLDLDLERKKGGERDWNKWHKLKREMDVEYLQEEQYWKQKARIQWLKEGDKNSKFFHALTLQRRKNNKDL